MIYPKINDLSNNDHASYNCYKIKVLNYFNCNIFQFNFYDALVIQHFVTKISN